MRTAVVLLAIAAGGCSVDHTFRLEDIELLTPGQSTRQEVEALLGEPWHAAEQAPLHVYRSIERRDAPPGPLPLITWPLYWSTESETFTVATRFDEQDLLVSATVTVEGHFRAFILIIAQPHFLGPSLDEEDLRRLRSIEEKGMEVKIRAYFSDCTVEEYGSFGDG